MTGERILIVDHDDVALEAMQSALRAEDFEVKIARSADEALVLAATFPFDAALVELRIPGTHGLHLARSLRTIQRDMVVVMTSDFEVSPRQLERCDCGAAAFVPKPSDGLTVSLAVRRALLEAFGPSSETRTCAAPVAAPEPVLALA